MSKFKKAHTSRHLNRLARTPDITRSYGKTGLMSETEGYSPLEDSFEELHSLPTEISNEQSWQLGSLPYSHHNGVPHGNFGAPQYPKRGGFYASPRVTRAMIEAHSNRITKSGQKQVGARYPGALSSIDAYCHPSEAGKKIVAHHGIKPTKFSAAAKLHHSIDSLRRETLTGHRHPQRSSVQPRRPYKSSTSEIHRIHSPMATKATPNPFDLTLSHPNIPLTESRGSIFTNFDDIVDTSPSTSQSMVRNHHHHHQYRMKRIMSCPDEDDSFDPINFAKLKSKSSRRPHHNRQLPGISNDRSLILSHSRLVGVRPQDENRRYFPTSDQSRRPLKVKF
eukprot:CAMPEP_0114994736 /NCGR_PEP_ID=MMETSP0216-20121206/13308_1 /TAXON_ID=223996 /ORGANISM="Protocruzia adherens, Strain Boccale" /LENGTH=335 /DNA_ID=CAMNT_0002358637 /DNA_START=306 /DNA_END=1313 /DNA_ORIENTATION=+